MKDNIFYITTPIYYVNDVPHIGHAYTTIAADVIARYKRLMDFDVLFTTGTDEHGEKVEKSAKSTGETPIELANRVVGRFKDLWGKLDISFNDFIRTTEARHKEAVNALFDMVNAKGDIYKGEYEDWYCVPCENFVTDTQLVNGRCPDCGRPVEKLTEESYFFRMSKYQGMLLEHIERHPDFIQPESKKNEVVSFIKKGLNDLSISRTSFSWGIKLPGDEKHVIYVWFDALANYLTVCGFPEDTERFSRYWPADIHLIGKDILRFHAVYWPTFLMAAGLPLPKKIFAHGWWTVDGQKMSKSLGNVVNPYETVEEYGVDVFRYFLLREVPFGLDGDFSVSSLRHRVNGELANDLGNLLSRSTGMVERYFEGVIDRPERVLVDDDPLTELDAVIGEYSEYMEGLEFSRCLEMIWKFIGRLNRFVDAKAPWVLAKDPEKREELRAVLYLLIDSLKIIGVLLYPFMPKTSVEMWQRLGIKEGIESIEDAQAGITKRYRVTKGEPLFKRLED